MKALQLLGSFPSKNCVYHAIRALVKVRRKLKKKSDDGIMLLPTMTDENKLYSMSILSSMTVRAFLCNKMPIVLLCILKQILYTFEYGLCPDSCVGFSSYGLVLCGTFGDQEGGNRMGRISRELLKLTQATTKIESQVLFTIAVYIDAWVIPIHRVLLAFQRSYESGMKTGDLKSVRTPNRASSGSIFHLHTSSLTSALYFFRLALLQGFRSWASCGAHGYTSGFPLDAVKKAGRMMEKQLQLYKVESIYVTFKPFRFTVL
jgi:hypothetical protein